MTFRADRLCIPYLKKACMHVIGVNKESRRVVRYLPKLQKPKHDSVMSCKRCRCETAKHDMHA